MPKWDPKAHVGIYFGHSPTDTGSVVLVLNPGTLHVFPQFHVNAQEGESLPTSHVTDVNLDYAVAINVAPIQNFPEETNESVTTSDSVPVPIVDSDLVLDSVPGRVVDRVSVRVNDSNFKMPKLANLYGLYRRKSSRTPKPSQRAKDYDDKTVKHLFGFFFSWSATVPLWNIVHAHTASKSTTLLEKTLFHAEKIHMLFDGSINALNHAYLSTVDNIL